MNKIILSFLKKKTFPFLKQSIINGTAGTAKVKESVPKIDNFCATNKLKLKDSANLVQIGPAIL
jgi:hypothetical protein